MDAEAFAALTPEQRAERRRLVRQRAALRETQRAQAMDLRLGGASYAQIGTALGVTVSTAHRLVAAVLDATRRQAHEKAEDVRAIELRRLEAIILAHWPRRSDPRNAEIVMKAIDRRTALLGLTPHPVRVEVEHSGEVVQRFDFSGLPAEELDRVRATLLAARAAAAGALPAAETTVEIPAPPRPGMNGHNRNGSNGTPHGGNGTT